MQVDQSFTEAIELTLSKSRLDAYRNYFDCKDDAEALGAYLWNKSLSTAFFPLLQAVEVTLRNAIHTAATKHFSGNQEWFLMKRLAPANEKAKRLYLKGYGKNLKPITPRPDPDTIISSLMFGFWIDLLNGGYDDPVNNKLLWPTLIPAVFPNAKGNKATRKSLHMRFKFIKDLRNRVGHNEPIWKIKDAKNGGGNITRHGPKTPAESIERLNVYVELLLEALRWMSTERHDFIRMSGIVDHLQQICSIEALENYQGNPNSKLKPGQLKHALAKQVKQTGSASGFYNLETTPKGVHEGKTLFLEVKQISPPKLD